VGLDTSHGCWHGAYSAFHRWRCKIAEVAGLPPLELMEGFWSPPPHGNDGDIPMGLALTIKCKADELTRRASNAGSPSDSGNDLLDAFQFPAIRWGALRPDALHILLRHSDCEGRIAPGQCRRIATRLKDLLPLMPEGDAGGHIGNWQEKTQTFIDGLLAAAAEGKPVRFG
jgi:hypothetical protein